MKIVEKENELYEVRDMEPGEVFIADDPIHPDEKAYFLKVDLRRNYDFAEGDYETDFGINLETGVLSCFDPFESVEACPEATIYFK